jgi:hypothetical protein
MEKKEETFESRFKLLNNHFNDEPYNHNYKFLKICAILAQSKKIGILNNGDHISFQGDIFLTYDLVMYIFNRSINKNVLNNQFAPVCTMLNFKNLL